MIDRHLKFIHINFQLFELMSNEKLLREEVDRLTQELKKIQEDRESQQHENRKSLLEATTKLDFQTRRAQQYEEKYKSTLQYKNQEQTLRELDDKLREKEDEVIKLLHADHQKSQQIQSLLEEVQELKKLNENLEGDLNQIKEAALSAIVDKDTTINQLSEKLQEYQDVESINGYKTAILDLEEKYRQLEERNQVGRSQLMSAIEEKEQQINQLQQKLSMLKDKHEERVSRLEIQISEYQKHIEDLAAEKDHEENLEQKYYHTEEKLRKTEKKLGQLEQIANQQKNELVTAIQKLEQQNQSNKVISDELKQAKTKLKQVEREHNSKKKELEQFKQKLEKATQDLNRKMNHLQSEKKIITDNLNIKQQQIQRLKSQLEAKAQQYSEPQLKKQRSSNNLVSPQKLRQNQDHVLVEKLKKQNKDLEETNQTLKKKLEEQTKQLQQARQKLIQARTSQLTNSQINKLKCEIQDITSYLKKVENDMLMKKITHAEDQNFWSLKQKKYKEEIENLNKKYKKQNAELLQRIDRMKKLVPKDKKTDYYQSGFK